MNIIKKNLIILFFIIQISNLHAANVAEDTTFSSSVSGTQYNVTADDVAIIVTDDITLSRNQKLFNINASTTGTTITVHSGSTITATNSNTVYTNGGELTITNSGTVSTSSSKAINVSKSDGASITNNSGGVISSNGNTILGDAGDGANNTTIDNSGEIFSTKTTSESSAIIVGATNTGTTITNNAAGSIYSKGNKSTIILGASSTLTNSGSIKNNKSVEENVIQLKGSNNTITLKDEGIVVGIIKAKSGETGNKLRLNHGVGSSYYYNTSGDFTLEDLDGNQVVKGSAGSVGQGGSETLDELLSYKSINLRNFFNEYNKLGDQDAWGETYISYLKRDTHKSNLATEYDLTNFGVNLINKIDNANFVIAFEGGSQDFVKDHNIDYQNITAGVYLPQKDNPYLNSDLFILGGITLKDGERTILTNTTTSGKLTIESDYETYEIHTGIKKNNSSSIPDFGFAASYSMTPSYDESEYFSWTDKHVGNLSIFFEDDYNLINTKDSKLFLGWTLDMRKMIGDNKQVYSINGTSATYKQHNDLTNEISLIANMGYEKKFSDKSKILFSLDAKNTNRYTKSFGANVSFKSKF